MTQREDKQRARTSRGELGKYFYNLSAMSFGTTVLGGGMAMVTETASTQMLLGVMGIGVFITIVFACIGYKIINIK